MRDANDFVDFYVAQDRKGQKQKPMIWDSLELFVKTFCNLTPVEVPSDDAQIFGSARSRIFSFCLIAFTNMRSKASGTPHCPTPKATSFRASFFTTKP